MTIPVEVVEIGRRVSYSDVANPRCVGRVTSVDMASVPFQFTVAWEEGPEAGSTVVSDLRQPGWVLVAEGGLFDGVDVTEKAREAGVVFPTALTRTAWEDVVAWDGDASQDEAGRLWDVLWMFRNAARHRAASRFRFEVLRVRQGQTRPTRCDLVAVCGPGDNAEPVITIMQPRED